MSNAIEIKGLCKDFKDFTLKDVSFSLPAGYIMGFVGKNGAGKTTTIRLILNMIERKSGSDQRYSGWTTSWTNSDQAGYRRRFRRDILRGLLESFRGGKSRQGLLHQMEQQIVRTNMLRNFGLPRIRKSRNFRAA